MIPLPDVKVKVHTTIVSDVEVDVRWPKEGNETMSEAIEVAGIKIGSGALALLLQAIRVVSKLSGGLTNQADFESAYDDAVGLIEAGVTWTPTKKDDEFLASVKPILTNPMVKSFLWGIYQQWQAEPSLAQDVTPERFAGMLQEQGEKKAA